MDRLIFHTQISYVTPLTQVQGCMSTMWMLDGSIVDFKNIYIFFSLADKGGV